MSLLSNLSRTKMETKVNLNHRLLFYSRAAVSCNSCRLYEVDSEGKRVNHNLKREKTIRHHLVDGCMCLCVCVCMRGGRCEPSDTHASGGARRQVLAWKTWQAGGDGGFAGAGRACALPCVCANRGESASGGVDSVRVAVFIGETKTENPAQTAERWLCVRACVRACLCVRKQLLCVCGHTCTKNRD